MNQTATVSIVPSLGAYVLYDFDVQRIEGELLTLIETLGFAEKQEQAVKSQVRRVVYQLYGLPTVEGSRLKGERSA